MANDNQTLEFKIQGMDCAEETAMLKHELGPLVGGEEHLAFDILSAKMSVDLSSSQVSEVEILQAVARTGLKAQPWRDIQTDTADTTGWDKWGRTTHTLESGVLILAGFMSQVAAVGWREALAGETQESTPLIARLFYLGAIATGSWYVLPKAWAALLRLRPDMNLLMMVAVAGALFIGEFLEGATVAFLFALSLALEAWSVSRARRAVAALMALSPDIAQVLNPDGREEQIPAKDVPVGATLVVRPGERFPLDGKVTKGETTVNQAPITGESMPVSKIPGSDVFAGTINEDGAIEVITTKPGSDTTLSRIIRMVGSAQSQRAASEQWVEQFARYYTPVVMALAVAVMVAPPLLLGGSWAKWFYEGLVLLVIACPCALVISTPVSIVAALASAAKQGVLIKGGIYLELMSRLKAISVDKTGTLTEGHPEVQQVVALNGHSEKEVLERAAAVEARSEHPLARAVLRFSEAQGIRPEPAENFQATRGKGATATIGGKLFWLGSHRLLEERGQETPEMHDQLEKFAAMGLSAIVIGNDQHVCGLIAVGDRVRANAGAAIRGLHAAGVERIVMLTGDNKATAEVVGREVGVDEIRAELLPEDKVSAMDELVRKYGHVAMVGDGVNDAPAMARATVGIAMGAVGTDAALETADIALMGDDLTRLPWLIGHSHRTMSIIRQNIGLSLAVKGCFVILTVAGHASLWTAIAADTGMSLLVVFNALRLAVPQGRD
jgi:Cd2+/Zn2+-exporting ATPase